MRKNVTNPLSLSLPLLGGLLLTGAGQAQSMLISPPGMYPESSGDRAYSAYLGGYVSQRYQLVDGSQRGSARQLKSLQMRRDTDPGYGMVSRSWQQVSLKLGTGKYEDFGPAFSQNFGSTPASLFAGGMTWSVPSGLSTRPAPFGSDGMAFPFRVPFAYDGVSDLVCEITFSGGQRSDGGSWKAGTLLPYYLDGLSISDFNDAKTRQLGTASCVDSSRNQAGLQRLYLQTFSASAGGMANQILHYQEVFHTAAGAPLLIGLGMPMPAALPATSCTQLWVNPLVVLRGSSDANGYLRTSLGSTPYQPQWAGLTLATQTAWADSSSGALLLSNGVAATIQAPPLANSLRAASLCTTSEAAPLSAVFGLELERNYLPILAWGL